MAIGWLSVIKMVPWGDVISNASKVAEGAKKLWSVASKKPLELELPTAGAQPALSPEAQSIAILQAQLAAALAAVSDLHEQMLASSELIKALAEQNNQLIERIETNRVRVLWLAAATAVAAIAAVVGLALAVGQHGA